MQLNTLYQYLFHSDAEPCRIDYFLTTDSLSEQHNNDGNVWLVISIEGDANQKFIVSKPSSILLQPREIVEVIIQRETINYLQHADTSILFQ
jgi:hypothetical protein